MLSSWVTRRRGLAWAVVGVLSLVAACGVPRLVFHDDPVALFRSDAPEWLAFEQVRRDFETGVDDLLVVVDGPGLFEPAAVAAMRRFVAAAGAVDGVVGVASVLDVQGGWPPQRLVPPAGADDAAFDGLGALLLEHPLVAGRIVSRDGRVMLVVVRLDRAGAAGARQAAVPLGEVRRLASREFGAAGLRARVTGEVAVRVDSMLGVMRDFVRLLVGSAVVASLLALVTVRHPLAAVVVVAGPAVGVLWTVGALGWAGVAIDAIGSVLPMMVFIVGFANAVHLMIDFRRCRRFDHDAPHAAGQAMHDLAFTCLLTAATTALGFGSLVMAQTQGVQRFGVACAFGTMVSLAAVLVVVPLLCAGPLGRRIPGSRAGGHHRRSSRWLARLALPSRRHPWWVAGAAVAASGWLLWLGLGLKPDLLMTEALPESSETAQALETCETAFGGASVAHVVVAWNDPATFGAGGWLPPLREVHDALQTEGFDPLSVLDYHQALGAGPAALVPPALLARALPAPVRERLIANDEQRLLVTLRLPNHGARAMRPVFDHLEARLAEIGARHPGFSLHLTGAAVLTARNIEATIRDLLRSLGVASVFVFSVIAISLRSLRAGLICILPNLFPLVFNAGMLAATGQSLRIAGAITFSVCLGIAVDNTIHFLMRFRRELAAGLGRRDALTAVFENTGRAMIISTVVILGGIAPALFSTLPSLHMFGGLACSALLAALVGDLLILPALLVLFWPRPRPPA